jgi:hypothetical protein
MPDWNTQKGITVPEATPTGDAGDYLKDNFLALRNQAVYYADGPPDAEDDAADGFAVGSRWFDVEAGTLWVCVDATAEAAEWRSVFAREPDQPLGGPLVLCPGDPAVAGSDGGLQLGTGGDVRGDGAVDLQSTRTVDAQVASGAKSAILGGENNTAAAANSIVLGGSGNQAGAAGAIVGISTGDPTTVVTSSPHGLSGEMRIVISDSNSTPSIDGTRVITVAGADSFTVDVNVTSAGDSGRWEAGHGSVVGGDRNLTLGLYSSAMGRSNTASGEYSLAEGQYTVAGGWATHAEGIFSEATAFGSHAEGVFTTASGFLSHVEGGAFAYSNTASGYASHAEGGNTSATGETSHAEGRWTTASGDYSHAGGNRSNAHLLGQWARAMGGPDDDVGAAQTTITQLFRRTTDASQTELTLGGSAPSAATRFAILDGQTLSCFVNIVGREENGGSDDHASFLRQVLIRRTGATTALVGAVQTVGADINPAGWGGTTITADDSNESLKIEVVGAASTNIRWMATVLASEAADDSL